jgi:hypothetical protein
MTTTPLTKLQALLTWPSAWPSAWLAAWPVAWPVDSQHTARRNALVASTALAQLRHERLEVERFLDQHALRRTPARSEHAARA